MKGLVGRKTYKGEKGTCTAYLTEGEVALWEILDRIQTMFELICTIQILLDWMLDCMKCRWPTLTASRANLYLVIPKTCFNHTRIWSNIVKLLSFTFRIYYFSSDTPACATLIVASVCGT